MTQLTKSDFYFDLPEELIAQDPLLDRSSSRLLTLNKNDGNFEHHIFKDIVDYLNPGDCLVLNNTKVIPARLFGVKEETGAVVEFLLLKRRMWFFIAYLFLSFLFSFPQACIRTISSIDGKVN